MTTPAPHRPARRLGRAVRAGAVDIGPLRRSRPFRLLFTGQIVSMLGRQVTVVALPFQVYSLTGSTFAVGALGAVQVVPLVGTALVGGAVADRVDRRRVLLGANAALAACSLALTLAALGGAPPVALVYLLAGLVAGLGALEQPARSATVPNLVDRSDLPAALALMFGVFQVTLVAGPALGGILIGRFGLADAYLFDTLTFGAALTAAALLPARGPRSADPEPPLRAIRAGLAFLLSQRQLIGSFAIDLDAMIFGMPRALFPVLAVQTFHAGPQGLGLLYSAPGVGAVVAVLLASGVARTRRLGRTVVIAVLAWGTAIALMGLTSRLWLALALLALAGGADAVSAICRGTLLQTATPDHLRGRAVATNSMVVMGGPYLGDLEGGSVGAIFTPAVSVVSGGVLCVAGVGLVCALFPQLWRQGTGGGGEAPASMEVEGAVGVGPERALGS